MNRLQKGLNQLEAQLRALIEGSTERLLRTESVQEDLAHELVQAMQREIQCDSDGVRAAPNLYTLSLPPHQAQALQENVKLLDELADSLEEYASQEGLHLHGKPKIKVISHQVDLDAQMNIRASFSPHNLGETIQIEINPPGETETIPTGAFLILQGTQIVPLTQAVINIGRNDENDLVITDMHVSREHAQLRAIRGRYMIFDLDSTGGTFVNGIQITQQELSPGDLISLAGIPIIYGHEQSNLAEETQDLREVNPLEGKEQII